MCVKVQRSSVRNAGKREDEGTKFIESVKKNNIPECQLASHTDRRAFLSDSFVGTRSQCYHTPSKVLHIMQHRVRARREIKVQLKTAGSFYLQLQAD